MPFLATYAAAFLTLTWHTNSGETRPHLSYAYCDKGNSGPKGWARSYLDTGWQAYVRGLQPSNCDLLGREIQAHLSF